MKQKTLPEAWEDIYKEIEFYDHYRSTFVPVESVDKFNRIVKHNQTKLTLGDFIPCKDGKPLEKPDFMDGSYDDNGYGDVDKYQYKKDAKEYQQALDRVVYKGWFMRGETLENESNTHTIILGAYTFILVGDNWVVTELKTRDDMAGFELTDNYAKKLYK